MSIKFAMLTLLAEKPRHGYQLKHEFDRRTNNSWPLNIGQVYTTLERLERDGLCIRGEENSDGRVIATITPAGREALRRWFTEPTPQAAPRRDELAIKIAMAVSTRGVDVTDIIQTQRNASMTTLQDYRRARSAVAPDDLAGQLILERMVYDTEAEIRWLDHCETAALRAARDAESRSRVDDEAESPAPAASVRS